MGTCVEKAKARQEWPARQNTLADWPRLAKAAGHPEPDPTLAGRIKAGGASIGRRLWAAGLHIAGHGEGESRRLGGVRAARCAAGDEAILLAVVGEREAHVERDLLG